MSRWSPLQRTRPTSRLLDILYYAISFAKLPFLHWCYKVLSWSPYTKSCLPVEINWQTEPQWHTANALLLRAHIGKVNTISIPHADFLFWKKKKYGQDTKEASSTRICGENWHKAFKGVKRIHAFWMHPRKQAVKGRGEVGHLPFPTQAACKTLHP